MIPNERLVRIDELNYILAHTTDPDAIEYIMPPSNPRKGT